MWKRIVRKARLAGVKPKDLRDSFASYLLTCGVQLGYLSRQLGHSNVPLLRITTPDGLATIRTEHLWRWSPAMSLPIFSRD